MNIEMSRTVNNLRSRIKTPSLLQPGQNQEDSSSREPVQVEPKSYFALERTYIQWISAALLLLTVSSIMMGSGSYNGTSSVIAFSSLILIVYASYCYFRRVKLLRSGNGYGYLDIVGPSILAAGVGLGVFIVFADAVKGSEFMPWGKGEDSKDNDRSNNSYYNYHKYDDRRVLTENNIDVLLQEVQGHCTRHSIKGINLLEYQPRDIVIDNTRTASELIVGTPQSLVSHPLQNDQASAFLAEIPDTEIQSVTMVGDRLFALSTGPSKTEVIEFNASSHYAQVENRFVIQDATSTTGSMVFIPSEGNHPDGKFYIYIDGTMHTYHTDQLSNNSESSAVLSRSGSINMKVLNRGLLLDHDDPIAAMEHFEGVTYVLREKQNTIEAWDLSTATLLSELSLPSVSNNDQWVGLAFQRSNSKVPTSNLRQKNKEEDNTSVYLHMPLDSFPPQLWSFRLEELEGKVNGHSVFSFPQCGGVALN